MQQTTQQFITARQVRKGDRVFYAGQVLTVSSNRPLPIDQNKRILQFVDSGCDGQILALNLSASHKFEVKKLA